jgi:hypothetical protein
LKNATSILLSSLLLFNWVGYRIFIDRLECSANSALEESLNSENYDPSQLILIKVPAVHYGYYTNSKQFERKDGQIEIKGEVLNFVKWRLYHDTLELLCIDNTAISFLQTAKNEFFRLVNDLQHDHSKKNLQNNNNNDFEIPVSCKFMSLNLDIRIGIFYSREEISDEFGAVIENPPEEI